MRSVLGAIALGVRLVYARGRLVVAQMVALLGVARISMHIRAFVRVGAHARLLVVLLAVYVRIVVEGAVTLAYGSPTTLILEVPVETCVGSMLGAFVLQEERALVHSKAF